VAGLTFGYLLDRGREGEALLEQCYGDIRDRSQNNGVRLLTYYLARHRRHQDQALAGCDKNEVKRLRRVKIGAEVVFDPKKHLQVLATRPENVTGAELLRAAVGYDQALLCLYRSVLAQPVSDGVSAVLQSLIRIEERDVAMMKKMIAMHYF
jgi:hypothetical protein